MRTFLGFMGSSGVSTLPSLPEDRNSIKTQLFAFIQSELLLQTTQRRNEWIVRCTSLQSFYLGPKSSRPPHIHEAAFHDGRQLLIDLRTNEWRLFYTNGFGNLQSFFQTNDAVSASLLDHLP